ncbi:MAG: MerR family transcriptional regulator [Candidatus Omnitrophota bacterium]|nr:MAG: MerR family transcriptional regulator [Candidatus Omnitrophota bacterium]
MAQDGKMTITQVAQKIGVVPKTILRWEKAGKVRKAKKDWRGWRVYTHRELGELKSFRSSLY